MIELKDVLYQSYIRLLCLQLKWKQSKKESQYALSREELRLTREKKTKPAGICPEFISNNFMYLMPLKYWKTLTTNEENSSKLNGTFKFDRRVEEINLLDTSEKIWEIICILWIEDDSTVHDVSLEGSENPSILLFNLYYWLPI